MTLPRKASIFRDLRLPQRWRPVLEAQAGSAGAGVESSDGCIMGRVERDREIARRRARRVKVKKLRTRFAAAKNATEKQAIREKMYRVSPFVVLED